MGTISCSNICNLIQSLAYLRKTNLPTWVHNNGHNSASDWYFFSRNLHHCTQHTQSCLSMHKNSTLMKNSQRSLFLEKVTYYKGSQMSEDDNYTSPIGIRTFCHTRWIVWGDATESILVNYNTLSILWEDSLQSPTWLDPDVKARVIGVQSQMSTFNSCMAWSCVSGFWK